MGTLMKADFYKLKKSRSWFVCIVVAFVIGVIMSVLYYMAWKMVGNNVEFTRTLMESLGSDEKTINDMLMVVPDNNSWAYISTALADTNVLYITAIVISIFVSSEYSMGTIKNSVSRGCPRTAVYFSKLIFSLAAMVTVVVSYLLGSGMVGCILFGFSAKISAGQILLTLAGYIVQFAAAGSVFVMIAVLMRKTGYAVAFSIVIPMLITSLLQVAAISVNNSNLFSRFWLFLSITSTQNFCLNGEAYVPFLVGTAYLVLSALVGIIVFRRQELK